MKKIQNFKWFMPLAIFGVLVASCAQQPYGEKVKVPFSGNKYESNSRFFRSVGKGISQKDNIAKSKADSEAKRILAAQVQTTVKVVTDQYLADTQSNKEHELNDKFQSLVREVTATEIGDLRKIGDEKYFNGENYTAFVAYEIKKSAMLRFLKKKAKADAKIDRVMAKTMESMLDKEIERLESLD